MYNTKETNWDVYMKEVFWNLKSSYLKIICDGEKYKETTQCLPCRYLLSNMISNLRTPLPKEHQLLFESFGYNFEIISK
mgnify:CR=1 FL=1